MITRSFFVSVVFVLLPVSLGLAATFHGLSEFGDGSGVFPSDAGAVSDNGQVVVGKAGGSTLYRWTPQTGAVEIDALVDSSLPGETRNRFLGISGNGQVIVGQDINTEGGREAFRWTESEGAVGLGFVVGGFSLSNAQAASQDGLVIAGHVSNSFTGTTSTIPYRWTVETGIVELGFVEGGTNGSHDTRDISAEGSIIVGSGRIPSETSGFAKNVGFRWSESDGSMKQLVPLAGEFTDSNAVGVSADGSVAVGESLYFEPIPGTIFSQGIREATMWRGLDPVSLGIISGFEVSSADAVNGNGSVVVGGVRADAADLSPSGSRAFLWNESDGMRLLQDVLAEDYGLDLPGWTLYEAFDITPNGQIILGQGLNPDGVQEAFIVTIPEPQSATLMLIACVGLLARKRR